VTCAECRHFDNRPEMLERVFPGLTSFGSGNASVRDQDGLCRLHERHLSSRSSCDYFSTSACSLTEPQLAPSHFP
jgi:hypothetical protein